MNGGLHPRVDVDQMYVSQSMSSRGLLSVEDTVTVPSTLNFTHAW